MEKLGKYLYTIGQSSPESSDMFYLFHDKKFTDVEFNRIVEECFDTIIEKTIYDSLFGNILCHNYGVFEKDTDSFSSFNFEHLIKDFVQVMIDRYDFKSIEGLEVVNSLHLSGWNNFILDHEDGYGRNDIIHNKLKDRANVLLDQFMEKYGDSLKNLQYGHPLIIVYGNKGSQKKDIVKKLCARRKDVERVLTWTNRRQRPGEEWREDYLFTDEIPTKDSIIFEMFKNEEGIFYSYKSTFFTLCPVLERVGIIILNSQGIPKYKKHMPNAKVVYIDNGQEPPDGIYEDKNLADHIIKVDGDIDLAVNKLSRIATKVKKTKSMGNNTILNEDILDLLMKINIDDPGLLLNFLQTRE